MTSNNKVTKRDMFSIFLRSLSMEFSWNYERQQNLGYVFAMIPALRKIYTKKEELVAALKRHLEFFNTTPHIVTLFLGISAAMEEQNATKEDFDVSTINAVKVSLMGPLAGIGDSFFWGTLRLLATGVGASLALTGNPLGPILFILIFNIPHITISYNKTGFGYKLGTGFLQKLEKTGTMGNLTYGAAVLGLMVIGSMSATMIDFTIPLSFGTGEAVTSVQSILDDIMPGILPLVVIGIVYWLLGRDYKPTTILLGMAVFSIAGAWFGIL